VAAQIARYRALVERDTSVPRDEAVSVFRLVGRRQDAALVFADAGRRAARYAARRVATEALARVSPNVLGRRLAARAARRGAREVFDAELGFTGGLGTASIGDPVAVAAWPGGEACAFHDAAFAELLRLLTGFEGLMRHEECRARGAATCVWRAVPAGDYE
jgi:predicted hydrocarbon binding protein